MGKRVRVFLEPTDLATLAPQQASGANSTKNQKDCKRPNQDCFFCDLLDCRQVVTNGEKQKVGTVRIFGKIVNVIFSPQEGCWLPSR